MGSQNKVLSYVGFAVKSRHIVYGASLIRQFKKRTHLLLLCCSAAENTRKEARAIADRNGIDIVVVKSIKLEEAVNKTNCKLVAVTDANLAKAIMNNVDGVNFELLKGGEMNG